MRDNFDDHNVGLAFTCVLMRSDHIQCWVLFWVP